MWANSITRNLNRSTWTDAISDPPPEHVANLLNAADSRPEQHISNLNRSSRLALDCVAAAIADNEQIRRDVDALVRRVEAQKNRLADRKAIIEAFIDELLPPHLVMSSILFH